MKIISAVKMWSPQGGIQGLWEGWKTIRFSTLSMVRHFHGASSGTGRYFPGLEFALRFPFQVDAVSVMHQPVEDSVGESRVF